MPHVIFYNTIAWYIFLTVASVAIPYVITSILVEIASLLDDNEGTLFRRFGLGGLTTFNGKEKRFLLPWIFHYGSEEKVLSSDMVPLFESIGLGIIFIVLLVLLSVSWGPILAMGTIYGIFFFLRELVRRKRLISVQSLNRNLDDFPPRQSLSKRDS